MVGIDISGVQPDDVPGNWDFIVTKLSENLSLPNHRVDAQWANAARTTRGFYHYARPLKSTGGTQANFFADQALARGFKPGKDIWQLDAEGGENEGTSGTTWRVFIDDFMRVATNRLGKRGFLYAGWPFLQGLGLADLPYRYMWWLPDYGPNNSLENHGLAHLGDKAGLVVIHQYTSFGGLDRNNITNLAAYLQAPPAPTPTPGGPVKARFDPPTPGFVDVLVTPKGAWGLGKDGGIFTFSGPFLGSAAGEAYFKGREGARLVTPGAAVPNAHAPAPSYPASALYEIVATSGERYVPTPPK